MSGEVTLATSTDVDEDFSCPSVDPTSPSCRWGDYAGASTDPSVQHTVWGTNQWNDTAAGANDAQWATQNFALIVNPVPTAAFSASPNPALTGQAVDFDASASSDTQGGGIASYGWDFGDGSTAAGVTAQHAYAAPGNYAVTLTVTDADGYSASVAHTVTGNAPAPPPPPPPTGTTTSSSPAPSPSPVTSPSGTTSPGLANLTLAVKSPRTIRAVLVARKGIAGAVQCSAACRATVVLVLPAKVAKHFHLRGKIGSASVRGGAGVRKGFRLRLTRSARRVLAGRAFAAYLKRHRVRATLRTVATGSGGRSVTVRKALTLRR